jgi:hypothetical protein
MDSCSGAGAEWEDPADFMRWASRKRGELRCSRKKSDVAAGNDRICVETDLGSASGVTEGAPEAISEGRVDCPRLEWCFPLRHDLDLPLRRASSSRGVISGSC